MRAKAYKCSAAPAAAKTSGSGAALAHAYLLHGFGGLVLTTKVDDRDLWVRACHRAGRLDDLIIFGPECPWRFNFLEYETHRPGRGRGLTENLVRLFLALLEATEHRVAAPQEPFWDRAVRQILGYAIDLLHLAHQPLTMQSIHRLIISAPKNPFEIIDEGWRKRSFCLKCVLDAKKRSTNHPDREVVEHFWLREYVTQDERTRSNVLQTFTTMADAFSRGLLRELFSTTLNLTPEATHSGKIILLDLPTKEYGYIGRVAQVLFKYLWQQAAERRDVRANPRPMFLWIDEAQEFIVSHDAQFQATARGARACSVWLSKLAVEAHSRIRELDQQRRAGGGEDTSETAGRTTARRRTRAR
jgi:hypothetical protein